MDRGLWIVDCGPWGVDRGSIKAPIKSPANIKAPTTRQPRLPLYHTISKAPTTRQPRLLLLSFHHQGTHHCQALPLEVSTITNASTKVYTNTKASTSNQGSYYYLAIFQGTYHYLDIHHQGIYHWKPPSIKVPTKGTCIYRHPLESPSRHLSRHPLSQGPIPKAPTIKASFKAINTLGIYQGTTYT